MKLAPYPKYKPSGVEWLGNVPEGWNIRQLKYAASINDETLPETTDPAFEMSYVDIGSVDAIEGIVGVEEMTFESAPSRARRIVRDGDTIVSTVRTYLKAIAYIREPKPNTVVSTGFAVIRPRTTNPAFLSYAMRETGLVETIVARSVGVSYPAVNASEIGSLEIPLPSHEEQRAIADFLDRQTAKIDTLIRKKQTLIERLQEKRAALITRTVTRGLPPEAARAAGLEPEPKMKASGVEWLGEVPAHWEILPLRRWYRVVNGGTPSSTEDAYWDGAINWITPEDLGRNRSKRIGNSRRTLSTEGLMNCGAQLVPVNSIVLSTRAPIGHIAVTSRESCTNQGCRTLVPKGSYTYSDYLYYALLASRPLLEAAGKGTTFMELSADLLGSHIVPFPPDSEQRAIADFLDRETAKIDGLIAEVDTAIARLREYRGALITAAVTGQVDVRGRSNGDSSREGLT